jgi:hypothetical protein
MDGAMRIGIDGPAPSISTGEIPDTSTRALADFAARYPEVARIKVM